jgi:hypothetical protein
MVGVVPITIKNPDRESISEGASCPTVHSIQYGSINAVSATYDKPVLSRKVSNWSACLEYAFESLDIVQTIKTGGTEYELPFYNTIEENDLNPETRQKGTYYTYDQNTEICYIFPGKCSGMICQTEGGTCDLTTVIEEGQGDTVSPVPNINLVSGYVHEDWGIEIPFCTMPLSNSTAGNCIANITTAISPPVCTGITKRGELGDYCRSWFNAYTEEKGDAAGGGILTSTCGKYGDLQECACINRADDEQYKSINKTLFGGVSDVCWYQACKVPGLDRLIEPTMYKDRDKCTGNYCGNFVSQFDVTDVNYLQETKQTVYCGSDEWGQLGQDGALAAGGGTGEPGIQGVLNNLLLYGGISVLVVILIVSIVFGVIRARAAKKVEKKGTKDKGK